MLIITFLYIIPVRANYMMPENFSRREESKTRSGDNHPLVLRLDGTANIGRRAVPI
jgi:hypothetical protein